MKNVKKMSIGMMVLFSVVYIYDVFGDGGVPKTYFVKPIEIVCDYPFNDTTKLAVTCRVWGLLKYFHPNVTAGKFDWDSILIRSLSKIDKAKTPEQVNVELMKMLQIAGEYEVSKDPAWNDSLNMNVNLCWLDHSFINKPIRQALKEIASLTVEQPSHYIKPHEKADYVPYPDNEKAYDIERISNYEYRLLALFRYWNLIYYFYPYKYLMDQSWDVTLEEFIPQFMTAEDVPAYHQVIRKLATRLNDGHAFTTVVPNYNQFNFKFITMI